MTMQFISWNVNGIRAAEKKGLADFIRKKAPDILALQETKANEEQVPETLTSIEGYHKYWHSAQKKGYSGVCTYSKLEPLNVIYGIGASEYDAEGRVLTLEFDDFYLVNCYFPNAQHELKRIEYKISFNETLLAYLNDIRKSKTVVVCGDYNVAHKAIDLKNPKANEKNPGYSIQERDWMDSFIDCGFVDSFRMFNQEADQYTWWSYRFKARARNIGWRIDYFCVNQEGRDRVKNASILQEVMGSDHCPVVIEFA